MSVHILGFSTRRLNPQEEQGAARVAQAVLVEQEDILVETEETEATVTMEMRRRTVFCELCTFVHFCH